VLALGLLIGGGPALATPGAPPPGAGSASVSREADLGAFITDLGDFNKDNNSFSARFWLWSLEPQPQRNILSTMEFPRALKLETGPEISTPSPQGRWLQRPVQGTFRHQWALRNFPFDRQLLRISMEETEQNSQALRYRPDQALTRIDPQLQLPGWRVQGAKLVATEQHYPTSFGDPALPTNRASRYARAELLIQLERTDRTGFLKLTAGAFMAAAMALASYGLRLDNPTALGPRLGLLAGCLFTTVISLRTASADLGSMASITLVDQIHLAVLAYILVATVVALSQWRLNQQGVSALRLQRRDLRLAGCTSLLFGLTVLSLLGMAMASGPAL